MLTRRLYRPLTAPSVGHAPILNTLPLPSSATPHIWHSSTLPLCQLLNHGRPRGIEPLSPGSQPGALTTVLRSPQRPFGGETGSRTLIGCLQGNCPPVRRSPQKLQSQYKVDKLWPSSNPLEPQADSRLSTLDSRLKLGRGAGNRTPSSLVWSQ
jgi:hypothetical protein